MQTFLFLRLSMVKHFPKAAVQTKKATLEGIFCFPNAFPRERMLLMANKKMVVSTNREPLSPTRQPMPLILLGSPNRGAIYGMDKAPESFHFPIVYLPTKLNLPMEDSIGKPHKIRHTCLFAAT